MNEAKPHAPVTAPTTRCQTPCAPDPPQPASQTPPEDLPLSSSQVTPQSTLPILPTPAPGHTGPIAQSRRRSLLPTPNHSPIHHRDIHAPSHCVREVERGAGRSVDPSMPPPRQFSWVERPPRVSSRPRGNRGVPSLPPLPTQTEPTWPVGSQEVEDLSQKGPIGCSIVPCEATGTGKAGQGDALGTLDVPLGGARQSDHLGLQLHQLHLHHHQHHLQCSA